MGFLGSGTLIRGLVAKINPADDDCLIIGDLDNTKMRKITFGDITAAIKKKLGIADINKSISELNSSLTTIDRHEMAGSTYLPPSYIYKNCKIVQFRCVGYAKKELNTGTAYQVGTLPEKYRPVADLYKYEQFVKGKECQVIILTTGEITVQFFENVSVDGAMNINVYFIAK